MDKFLEIYNLPSLNHEQMENMNTLISVLIFMLMNINVKILNKILANWIELNNTLRWLHTTFKWI